MAKIVVNESGTQKAELMDLPRGTFIMVEQCDGTGGPGVITGTPRGRQISYLDGGWDPIEGPRSFSWRLLNGTITVEQGAL